MNLYNSMPHTAFWAEVLLCVYALGFFIRLVAEFIYGYDKVASLFKISHWNSKNDISKTLKPVQDFNKTLNEIYPLNSKEDVSATVELPRVLIPVFDELSLLPSFVPVKTLAELEAERVVELSKAEKPLVVKPIERKPDAFGYTAPFTQCSRTPWGDDEEQVFDSLEELAKHGGGGMNGCIVTDAKGKVVASGQYGVNLDHIRKHITLARQHVEAKMTLLHDISSPSFAT